MNKSRLTYLFKAYFNKVATKDEREELMELLILAENDEHIKYLLSQSWLQFKSQSNQFTNDQAEEMVTQILGKDNMHSSGPVIMNYKRSNTKWLRILAAAAILFFGVTGIYFWLNSGQPKVEIAQLKKVSKKVIVPGGNKAVLTLSDGSSIILDSTQQGTLTKQGNAKVMKLNAATIAYNDGNKKKDQPVVYNTLSTPRGGKYQLVLPDGTKVWLNASSSIRFPTVFEGKERNVTVTGETYFEVAKNPAMPFKIKANDMEVQVFGTHFDIMAYDDESSINTTLLEGSLKVTKGSLSKMLVPGQQSIVNKTGDIKVVDASIDEVMAWKNGWFQFNAYDIGQVMRQISRWYNVDIVYEGRVPVGHYTGMVSRENDISQVLKIMEAGGVRFKIEGRKVVVLS
ncbi:MAG: FecR domain-containing protein [Bacteroidota bacterium]|nr:FecR domain-containing protein [Bacteroidota bacterium]